MNSAITFLSGSRKTIVICLLLAASTITAYSQCACPNVNACGPCMGGGLKNITLRYDGSIPVTGFATAEDAMGQVGLGVIALGTGTINVTSSPVNTPFNGGSIDLFVNGVLNATIITRCSTPVYVGNVYGNFTVLSAESMAGGPVCCSPPVINNCPSNITIDADPGSCGVNVPWTEPTATGNCTGISSFVSSHVPGAFFSVGGPPVTVTYTATDGTGATAVCSFTVKVKDVTNPVIPVIADITVPSGSTTCDAIVIWPDPPATDNCAIASRVSAPASGTTFNVGTTPVTYTVTDVNGNIFSQVFNVNVVDDTDPVIANCPSTITISANADCNAVVTWIPPGATDNCSGTITFTASHDPGDTFLLGTTTVTYTATDAAGNTSAPCIFDVIVIDDTDPVISGFPDTDIIVMTGESCGAPVTWPALLATDCGAVTLSNSHSSGDVFPIGTTEVTCTATDNIGNSSTFKFKVIVQDKTGPVFNNCVTEVTAFANESCNANVSWVPPSASDNCEVATVTASHNPGDTFTIGTTEVTYTATDIYGNVSVCRFKVVVKNENQPVISGCPEDIIARADESGEVNIEWTTPVATAQCGEVTLTGSHNPQDVFSLGTTEVEYKATDNGGKTVVCKFNVIVSYEALEFVVTKIITPDGNGINDQWLLPNIEKFKNNSVVVVDRWGSVIYSATGYNNENVVWKGVNNSGVVVPTGTYFYTISVRFVDKVVEKRGFIELIR